MIINIKLILTLSFRDVGKDYRLSQAGELFKIDEGGNCISDEPVTVFLRKRNNKCTGTHKTSKHSATSA